MLFRSAVVNDAHAKKRGRRPQIVETVKALSDTRPDIIARARAFLDGRMPEEKEGVGTGRVPKSEDKAEGPSYLPATQPFGDSVLARMFQPRALSRPPSPTQVYTPTASAAAPSPPSTQPFGESALAQMFQPRPRRQSPHRGAVAPRNVESTNEDSPEPLEVPSDMGEEMDLQDSVPVASNANPVRLPSFYHIDVLLRVQVTSSHSSSELHQERPLVLNPSEEFPDLQEPFSWNEFDDDAILHFSGGDDRANSLCSPHELHASFSEETALSSALLPNINTKDPLLDSPIPNDALPYNKIPHDPLSHSPQIPYRFSPEKQSHIIPTQVKKRRSRKGEAHEGSQVARVTLTDEELHRRLKDCILADRDLYMRVLRFEVQ